MAESTSTMVPIMNLIDGLFGHGCMEIIGRKGKDP